MARGKDKNKKKNADIKVEGVKPAQPTEENGTDDGVPAVTAQMNKAKLDVVSPRNVTGYLTSFEKSRDIKIDSFSLSMTGTVLISDTRLELNWGRRYGLIGLNGCGKSTLLKCLGEREAPLPSWMNVFLLEQEMEPSDLSALDSIIKDVDAEIKRLEAEAEKATIEDGPDSEKLQFLYDCLDELDPSTVVTRASSILHGLGFTKSMQQKKTKDFSGGWRMRLSLAKALFMKPTLLLLDEPTNHLDLEACVWLEDHLKTWDNRIMVIISHSQDFLNGVCTNIMHFQNKRLTYYTGNYDTYVRARAEKEENQMKQYNREQDEIKHMKDYIARFGHGSAKLARQAQSKEKTLARMEEKGLTERVNKDSLISFHFLECGTLPPPILQFNHVHFGYTSDPKDELYTDIDFGIDLDSRVALVGKNGAGKSTLVKLMVGTVQPTKGMVRRHHKLRTAWYHQHLTDTLDLDLSAIQFIRQCFPEEIEEDSVRRIIGRFGVTGKDQTVPMKILSDGVRSRVVIAWLAWQTPHLLLLDEPTNHLDLETIDALADAINAFEGGLVLVSHDFRLINQVAKEIWVCEDKGIHTWKGDIQSYKNELRKRVDKDTE